MCRYIFSNWLHWPFSRSKIVVRSKIVMRVFITRIQLLDLNCIVWGNTLQVGSPLTQNVEKVPKYIADLESALHWKFDSSIQSVIRNSQMDCICWFLQWNNGLISSQTSQDFKSWIYMWPLFQQPIGEWDLMILFQYSSSKLEGFLVLLITIFLKSLNQAQKPNMAGVNCQRGPAVISTISGRALIPFFWTDGWSPVSSQQASLSFGVRRPLGAIVLVLKVLTNRSRRLRFRIVP